MSIDSNSQDSKQRFTFRPSKEVMNLLEKIPMGKRTDYINKLLLENRQVEAALRAARLKIAALEREITSSRNICHKCQSNGKFFATVLGHRENKVVVTKVTAYCDCGAGKEQQRQSRMLFESALVDGTMINTHTVDLV